MDKNENKNENSMDSIKELLEIGIKEISNKTFIHEDELERFLNGRFENINKTKAMGFIQILQREYHVDLSDLKHKYLSFLEENNLNEPKVKQSLIMEEVKSEERKKSFFSLIFLFLAIGSIAYLIDKYDLLNFNKPSDINTAIVGEQKKEDSSSINLNKIENEDKKVNTKTDGNSVDVHKVLKESKASENSDNENKLVKTNQNLDLSQLNSDLLTSNQSADTNDSDINSSDSNNLVSESNTTNPNSEATTNEMYILPSAKVWIGTIDLNTLKKQDFLAAKGKRVDIDISDNKLIMIGHKYIKIYFNGKLVKFKRKGPIRFKYIDGDLQEISRKEFNSLAKGRQW